MFDRPGRLRLTEPPEAALALALSEWAGSRGTAGLLFVARSEARAEQLASAARCFASNDQEVLLLPPWDCLPFDRSSPSPAVMGHRIATLVRLGEPALAGGRLLIAPAEALVQRIAPSTVWPQAALTIQRDDVLRGEELRHFVLRAGYVLDERVDEPGEIAIRGQVIDLFPADAPHPYRIRLAPDDRVAAIQRYDPASRAPRPR